MPLPLRLLLVEDSKSDATLLVSELRRGPWDVTHERVDSAADLSAAIDRGPWDLIISDYTLPQFDGTAALAMARAADLDVPFILVSGTVGEDVAVQALKAGANDYLFKGHLERLVPAVERELRDAGERRSAREIERRLAVSEMRHRRLFETSYDGILLLDAATGEVLEANRVIGEVLGRDRDELLGRRLWEIGVFPDEPAAAAALAPLARVGRVRYGSLPVADRDGNPRPVEFIGNLYREGDRDVVQCSVRDTSDGRCEQESIRESDERLRLLVDGVGDYGIFLLDADGRVASWNAGAERITGYAADHVIGAHIAIFYPPEEVAAGGPAAELREARERGRWEYEGHRMRADGTRFWASVMTTALRDDRGPAPRVLQGDARHRRAAAGRGRRPRERGPAAGDRRHGRRRHRHARRRREHHVGQPGRRAAVRVRAGRGRRVAHRPAAAVARPRRAGRGGRGLRGDRPAGRRRPGGRRPAVGRVRGSRWSCRSARRWWAPAGSTPASSATSAAAGRQTPSCACSARRWRTPSRASPASTPRGGWSARTRPTRPWPAGRWRS